MVEVIVSIRADRRGATVEVREEKENLTPQERDLADKVAESVWRVFNCK